MSISNMLLSRAMIAKFRCRSNGARPLGELRGRRPSLDTSTTSRSAARCWTPTTSCRRTSDAPPRRAHRLATASACSIAASRPRLTQGCLTGATSPFCRKCDPLRCHCAGTRHARASARPPGTATCSRCGPRPRPRAWIRRPTAPPCSLSPTCWATAGPASPSLAATATTPAGRKSSRDTDQNDPLLPVPQALMHGGSRAA